MRRAPASSDQQGGEDAGLVRYSQGIGESVSGERLLKQHGKPDGALSLCWKWLLVFVLCLSLVLEDQMVAVGLARRPRRGSSGTQQVLSPA